MTVEAVLTEHARSIGSHTVGRVLPQVGRRAVGPFVFFDHMGPMEIAPGAGFDVAPHPHIGLSTLSFLLEGDLVHRDSLGSIQPLGPGGVNFMTAGRGIVHSERGTEAQRVHGARFHGLQFWVALPLALEDCAPSFQHVPAEGLPNARIGDVSLRVVVGDVFGVRSPLDAFAPLFLVLATMPAGTALSMPAEFAERAVYVVAGAIEAEGSTQGPGQLVIFGEGPAEVRASAAATLAIFGGPPLDAPRYLFWNFVSSSKDRLEVAKTDWRDQTARFAKIPGDDQEYIPLP